VYVGSVRRLLKRQETSQLLIWTENDGPLPVSAGSVGVEFRGRLGHPSSYGLLAGRRHSGPGVRIDLDTALPGAIFVPCDRVRVGLSEDEYRVAIVGIDLLDDVGVVVTAAADGEIGSSSWVFRRLASVLATLVVAAPDTVADECIWDTWADPT
jgi:hypothetical protein